MTGLLVSVHAWAYSDSFIQQVLSLENPQTTSCLSISCHVVSCLLAAHHRSSGVQLVYCPYTNAD